MSASGVYFQATKARPELLEPRAPGAHVWVAVAAFVISPEAIRAATVERVHLDRENLAQIRVGCYVCEEPWSEALSYRRCPGDPNE